VALAPPWKLRRLSRSSTSFFRRSERRAMRVLCNRSKASRRAMTHHLSEVHPSQAWGVTLGEFVLGPVAPFAVRSIPPTQTARSKDKTGISVSNDHAKAAFFPQVQP